MATSGHKWDSGELPPDSGNEQVDNPADNGAVNPGNEARTNSLDADSAEEWHEARSNASSVQPVEEDDDEVARKLAEFFANWDPK